MRLYVQHGTCFRNDSICFFWVRLCVREGGALNHAYAAVVVLLTVLTVASIVFVSCLFV